MQGWLYSYLTTYDVIESSSPPYTHNNPSLFLFFDRRLDALTVSIVTALVVIVMYCLFGFICYCGLLHTYARAVCEWYVQLLLLLREVQGKHTSHCSLCMALKTTIIIVAKAWAKICISRWWQRKLLTEMRKRLASLKEEVPYLTWWKKVNRK